MFHNTTNVRRCRCQKLTHQRGPEIPPHKCAIKAKTPPGKGGEGRERFYSRSQIMSGMVTAESTVLTKIIWLA